LGQLGGAAGAATRSIQPVMTPSWLHWLDTCPSTNTWALAHRDKLQHGDVVFTEQQTAGRGQHGRTWQAPAGVLTASFVLDVSQPLTGFSLAAGLAVIYAVEELLPELHLQLKWPNDVWLQQRKLAGILCETSANRLVVGVGLNYAVNFSETQQAMLKHPMSLHQVVRSVPSPLQLLIMLRRYLLQAASLYANAEPGEPCTRLTKLLPELNRRNALQGQQINIQMPQETLSGKVVGIDTLGGLLLQLADQSVRSVISGHVDTQIGNPLHKVEKTAGIPSKISLLEDSPQSNLQ
jgi:BirA family transcriptional regulator, biotin operon repressor / biotin---[acetyl-CoA-carboxylase] ligase